MINWSLKLREWAAEVGVEGDLNCGLSPMTFGEMEWLDTMITAEIQHDIQNIINEGEAIG
jgi:hypothetical protein